MTNIDIKTKLWHLKTENLWPERPKKSKFRAQKPEFFAFLTKQTKKLIINNNKIMPQ